MALKLKGSTSGFVGLDAPSVSGNNTLILPENSGSAFQIFANDITAGVTTFTQVTVSRNGDLTVPGTISIGGTLTYEDVTSVDSVGIVTARSGVRINGGGLTIIGDTTGLKATGISTFVDVSERNLTVTGVGTFSGGLIHVTSATSPAIRLQDTNNANSDFKIYSPDGENHLRIYHQNTTSDLVTVTSGGNVGINSTIPTQKLDVLDGTIIAHTAGRNGVALNGIANQDVGVVRWAGDNHHAIILRGSSNNDGSTITGGDSMEFREYGAYIFKTGNNSGTMTEKVRIDTGGNLLVGTTSAAGRFCVQGAAGGVALQTTDATNSTFRISHPSSAVTLLSGGSSQHLALGTGFAEKMRITSDGNVGIGEDNPSSKLVVEGQVVVNNSNIIIDKHHIDGTDDWAGASHQLHHKRTFTNNTWTNYFKLYRSTTTANNNNVGVYGAMLHIVYINDRSNSVQTTGYDVFPFVVRARSSSTLSGTFGSALVDLENVIGSAIEVRFDSATANQINIQVKINNVDAGGSEQLAHVWIDGGGVASSSSLFLYPSILT